MLTTVRACLSLVHAKKRRGLVTILSQNTVDVDAHGLNRSEDDRSSWINVNTAHGVPNVQTMRRMNLEAVRTSFAYRKFVRTHMGHAHEHSFTRNGPGNANDAGEQVSRLGLIADICLSVGKGFAGYVSGSTAVVADAAHSMSDVVLSAAALWVFKAARAPKDKMHPYGHGKFETLGALGISSMLLLTGAGIAWHAFEVLQDLLSSTEVSSFAPFSQSSTEHAYTAGQGHSHDGGHHHGIDKEHQTLALSATLISICIKEGLYWITKRVGDASGSELLKANAWHHRSDAISSVVALIGVGGSMLGWEFLDPVAGLFVSGLIIRAGVQTGYKSLQELVDTAIPDSALSSFKESIMKIEGVKGCHHLRGRRAGSSIHLDVHIEVNPWISVSAAHMIGEAVRRKLHEEHPFLEDIFVHIEPSDAFSNMDMRNVELSRDLEKKSKCTGQVNIDFMEQQEVEKAVRAVIETESEKMTFEQVRCHFIQGCLFVELEVSMDPAIIVKDAKEHAQNVEKRILKAYPKISALHTQLKL